jgi:exopolyphosphatase/guanosine-5'-triphosphate,3'-diphosphate pyrophosphatase
MVEYAESFSAAVVKQGLAFFPGGRVDAVSFESAVQSARGHFADSALPLHEQAVRTVADLIARHEIGSGRIDLPSLHALKNLFIGAGHASASVAGCLAILIAWFQDHPDERPVPAASYAVRDVPGRHGAVTALATRFGVDQDRAIRTAHAASALYAQLRPGGETYTELLYWAGLLHETGLAIADANYHRHSAYVVEHAELPGFTAREQKSLARLLAAQKGNLRKVSDALPD